jgi:hypothetical protein
MAYGPDNDCQLDDTKTTSVAVSPGFGAYFRFACPAASSPAAAGRTVCFYRADQGAIKLAERRLTATSLAPWSSGRNSGEVPVIYVITAWRKKSQPDGGSLWRQITVRSVLDSRHEVGSPIPAADEQDSDDVVVSVDVSLNCSP